MPSQTQPAGGTGLPEGYVAVPLEFAAASGEALATTQPLRVCLLVRTTPDPVGGRFVLLRQTPSGRAFLSCLADAAGSVVDWLELWVEQPPGVPLGQPLAAEETNAQAAARWDEMVGAFGQLGKRVGFLASGWEAGVGRPLMLEWDSKPGDGRMAPVVDVESGQAWALCTDEAVLLAAGAAGYAASPHRYLYLPSRGNQSPLLPVTPGAPPPTQPAALPAPPAGKTVEPFNLPAGRMLLRRHGPIPLEALVDVLAGRPWRGVRQGAGLVQMGGGVEALRLAAASEGESAPDAGRLFLGQHGRRGRIVESFHLRLRLVADMVTSVRQAVLVTGRPLLSVGPQSFQIRLPEPAIGFPFLWGAQVSLADAGSAIRTRIPGSEQHFLHLAGDGGAASIYRRRLDWQEVVGDCVVRVRRVVADAEQGAVVEGTLSTTERIKPASGQLLRLRLPLGSGPLDVYARLEETPPAAGEWRFRGVGQRFPAAAAQELSAAAGVPLQRVPFGLIPTAGAASDLYALAVLAVQSLLADEQGFPLPVALDEVLSLARQLAEQHDAGVGVGLRVRSIVETDKHWAAVLGPHRLMPAVLSGSLSGAEAAKGAEAAELIPAELWWDCIAAILRMIPQAGPDSICPTWGDATEDMAPHRVFDPTLAELEQLIRRSRSLIVIDWQFNREIRLAIDARLGRVEEDVFAPAASGRRR
jgi:hypothetical protein